MIGYGGWRSHNLVLFITSGGCYVHNKRRRGGWFLPWGQMYHRYIYNKPGGGRWRGYVYNQKGAGKLVPMLFISRCYKHNRFLTVIFWVWMIGDGGWRSHNLVLFITSGGCYVLGKLCTYVILFTMLQT
jgi:hypothetical protein